MQMLRHLDCTLINTVCWILGMSSSLERSEDRIILAGSYRMYSVGILTGVGTMAPLKRLRGKTVNIRPSQRAGIDDEDSDEEVISISLAMEEALVPFSIISLIIRHTSFCSTFRIPPDMGWGILFQRNWENLNRDCRAQDLIGCDSQSTKGTLTGCQLSM